MAEALAISEARMPPRAPNITALSKGVVPMRTPKPSRPCVGAGPRLGIKLNPKQTKTAHSAPQKAAFNMALMLGITNVI